jgi:hypothetical protein
MLRWLLVRRRALTRRRSCPPSSATSRGAFEPSYSHSARQTRYFAPPKLLGSRKAANWTHDKSPNRGKMFWRQESDATSAHPLSQALFFFSASVLSLSDPSRSRTYSLEYKRSVDGVHYDGLRSQLEPFFCVSRNDTKKIFSRCEREILFVRRLFFCFISFFLCSFTFERRSAKHLEKWLAQGLQALPRRPTTTIASLLPNDPAERSDSRTSQPHKQRKRFVFRLGERRRHCSKWSLLTRGAFARPVVINSAPLREAFTMSSRTRKHSGRNHSKVSTCKRTRAAVDVEMSVFFSMHQNH